MSPDLERLVEKARLVEMTDNDKEEQRRSFAFGSANIENGDVTREIVNEAARRLNGEHRHERSIK